jgi:hypothetical protein
VIISHNDPHFVFIEVPRTASRSMGRLLRKHFGAKLHEHHSRKIPAACRPWFTFACIRNPYARLYSYYCYRSTWRNNSLYPAVHRMRFPEYVDWAIDGDGRNCESTQHAFLDGVRLDAILRFENLQELRDLPFMRQGPTVGPFPHLGKTGAATSWRAAYDQRLADRVARWAKDDFRMFSYDPESWRYSAR